VLHHGSLVLRCPPATPFAAAVADTVDPATVLPALAAAMVARLAAALQLEPVPGAATAAEQRLAAALQRDRYADRAFTSRR
jgi:hypothetical protein